MRKNSTIARNKIISLGKRQTNRQIEFPDVISKGGMRPDSQCNALKKSSCANSGAIE